MWGTTWHLHCPRNNDQREGICCLRSDLFVCLRSDPGTASTYVSVSAPVHAMINWACFTLQVAEHASFKWGLKLWSWLTCSSDDHVKSRWKSGYWSRSLLLLAITCVMCHTPSLLITFTPVSPSLGLALIPRKDEKHRFSGFWLLWWKALEGTHAFFNTYEACLD